jgi:ribose 5-phosphate isomerase B
MKNIAIASDHAGFEMKLHLIEYLEKKGYEIKDFGAYSNERCDYPDFAHPLAFAIENRQYETGITICGSGNGINMTVNKHQGIRSALCWNEEIAKFARLHNDANVCALPSRFISEEIAEKITDIFLNTGFEGGRHISRIQKIPIEKKEENKNSIS